MPTIYMTQPVAKPYGSCSFQPTVLAYGLARLISASSDDETQVLSVALMPNGAALTWYVAM